MSIKQTYVQVVHALRPVAQRTAVLPMLERRSESSRWARWGRSLFAIHDSEAMIALDLPWWNLVAIDRVDAFLRSRQSPTAFEYGSGASTTWLARRCSEVISVEHDAVWAEHVLRQTRELGNVSIIVAPPAPAPTAGKPAIESSKAGESGDFRRYVETIAEQRRSFDLIVVDGRCRGEALMLASDYLKQGGMVVLDNAVRSRYQRAVATLMADEGGLEIEKHYGLCACLPYPDATWLFRSKTQSSQPPHPS